MDKGKWALILLFFFIYIDAFGQRDQNSNKLNLEKCIEYAIKNSSDANQAQFNKQLAEVRRKRIVARGLPKLNTGFDITQNFLLPTLFFPIPGTEIETEVTIGQTFNANFSINASIEFSFDYLVALGTIPHEEKYSALELRIAHEGIHRNVSNLYYAQIIFNQSIETLSKLEEKTQERYTELQKTAQLGLIEQVEVDRVYLLLKNVQLSLSDALQNQKNMFRLLKLNLGMDMDESLVIEADYSIVENYLKQDDLPIYNTENLSPYQQFKSLEKLSQANLRAEKLKRYPSISLSLIQLFNFQKNDLETLFTRTFPSRLLSLNISLPIYQGGKTNNDIKEAKVQFLQVQDNISKLDKTSKINYNNNKELYQQKKQNLDLRLQNLNLSKEILRQVELKYKNGLSSSIEFVEAQRSVLQEESLYFSAVLQTLQAKLNLENSLGYFKYLK